MFKGDRSRKNMLVEYGFRLPCARDNRPLTFAEWEARVPQCVFVSATPAAYELEKSQGLIVEQVVRPTGLVDPVVEVRPADSQVDDLLDEIRARAEQGERSLITTLTKRMAEDLTEYYRDVGVRVRYMHSDVETLERIELLRALRAGDYDVLVGINLLREGLDIPEVSLVAILDADKEGFLRAETSLIQTCGRASRNINGAVIMYANERTGSMKRALAEMDRRRQKQVDYNEEHNITPRSVQKAIHELERIMPTSRQARYQAAAAEAAEEYLADHEIKKKIVELRKKMQDAAGKMEFEEAAGHRDRLLALERRQIEIGV